MKRTWKYANDIFILAALASLTSLLHHSALSGSWRWDDGMHLLRTTQYSWQSIFLDSEVLRSVSGNQFAPWNIFIYYLNSAIFGDKAALYYAHHLFSIFSAATGVYILLRQWLPTHRAWVAPALLVTGVPAFQMAQQLMVGHYLDGMLFSSIGLVFLIRATKAQDNSVGATLIPSLASAIFYGLACLCKEIYAPWILMWIVIPWALKSSPKKMVLSVLPALLVAAAYTIARMKILGGAEDYYGGGVRNWEAMDVMQSLASIPSVLLGDGIRGLASLALVLLALFAGSRRTLVWGLVGTTALLITLVPLVFLAGSNPPWDVHARYLWAPWFLLCLVWAVPWAGAFQRLQWVACLLFTVLVVWQVVLVRPDDQQREAMFDAHSRMVFQHTPKVTHWAPTEFNGSGYMTFVTYAAHEAMRRNGYAAGTPPKLLRAIPDSPAEQAAVQVWYVPCNCFRPLAALTSDERDATLARMQAEKGMLLPGIHPLADAYQGPSPEMRIEGNRLYIAGTAASEGVGHVLLLAGWAPSRLVSSRVTSGPSDNAAGGTMHYEILLESQNSAAALSTRQRLCVLMQSQTHPHSFVALDSEAPMTACRKLLTPWALSQHIRADHHSQKLIPSDAKKPSQGDS